MRNEEESQMRNSIFPNINNEREELLNCSILSIDLNMQSKINQFMMRDIKPIDNNNNDIKAYMEIENINEKELELETSNISINSDEKEKNNNNIIKENNNINNQEIDGFRDSTINNINSKIFNNKVNDFDNKSSNTNNDNIKHLNNNLELKSKQMNSFDKNQIQQNFSQNQNINYNNNKNISQNNENNSINNYDIQNQIKCNNNNLIQNNNNQDLLQNNNMIMNNNFNKQQNNQFVNFNNVQNNISKENNLLLNYNQNVKYNNDLQNNQNNKLEKNYQQNFNISNSNLKMMMNYYKNLMNNQNFINNINYLNNNNIGMQYPHKSGLQNIGQTCYMNATIECLSNIKEITDYLLNLNENFVSKEKSLTLSYRSLLNELFLSGKKYIVPQKFKLAIGELNPLFQGIHAVDSKDLLCFIIERLHQELSIKNENIPKKKDFYQFELESRDENLTLQNFFNDFKLKGNSIIIETFYGMTRSIMICKGCGIKKYSFQSFNMQIFELKYLKEKKVLHIQNNEKLNLIEAFLLQQMPELLTNENKIYCNNCKGLEDGVHQQSIYQLPKVLIIILNRGRNSADFTEEFDFPAILDLRNQNILIDKNSPHLFYLCGIITHLSKSSSGGHFIAYCRNNQNENFTFYNDSIVSEVSIESAISYKSSDNEYEKKTPYILFYHYI